MDKRYSNDKNSIQKPINLSSDRVRDFAAEHIAKLYKEQGDKQVAIFDINDQIARDKGQKERIRNPTKQNELQRLNKAHEILFKIRYTLEQKREHMNRSARELQQKREALTSEEKELLQQGERLDRREEDFEQQGHLIEDWQKKLKAWEASLDEQSDMGTQAIEVLYRQINTHLAKSEFNQQAVDIPADLMEMDSQLKEDTRRHARENQLWDQAIDDFKKEATRYSQEFKAFRETELSDYEKQLPNHSNVAFLRDELLDYHDTVHDLEKTIEELSKRLEKQFEIQRQEFYKRGFLFPLSKGQEFTLRSSLEEKQEDDQMALETGKPLEGLNKKLEQMLLGELPAPTEINVANQESLDDMQDRHILYSCWSSLDHPGPSKIATLFTAKGREMSLFDGQGMSITLAQEAEFLEAVRKELGGDHKIRQIRPACPGYNCFRFALTGHRDGNMLPEDAEKYVEDGDFVIIQKRGPQINLAVPDFTYDSLYRPQERDLVFYYEKGKLVHAARISEIEDSTDQGKDDLPMTDAVSQVGDPLDSDLGDHAQVNCHFGDNKISAASKWGAYGEYECEVNDYVHAKNENSSLIIFREGIKHSNLDKRKISEADLDQTDTKRKQKLKVD